MHELTLKESDRFLKTVQNLTKLKSGQLNKLNIEIKSSNKSVKVPFPEFGVDLILASPNKRM